MNKILFVIASSACALVSYGTPILTGSVDIDPATTVDLSTNGTLDWAIWNNTSGTGVGSMAPTNVKLGGPGLFSAITPVGSSTVRGVGSATEKYTYTNGVSPLTLSPAAVQGFVINSTLATAGRGVQLSIQGDSTQRYHVEIWAVGFAGQGTMTGTLAGATSVALNSEIFGFDGANKVANRFSFDFQPDNNADQLHISFVLRSNDIGFNGHVGIQAITVSTVIPEPATTSLLLGGFALLLGAKRTRRRRRQTTPSKVHGP